MSQRWPVKDESNSIDKGLGYFQNEVGEYVRWYVYDPINTVADNIYDVGRPNAGRRWKAPLIIPVINANHVHGSNQEVEPRGFYSPDNLHLVISYEQARAAGLKTLAPQPDRHYNDRLVYHNSVWEPNNFQIKSLLLERYNVVAIDCIQIMPDELLNDPDFAAYATQPSSSSGVSEGHYGALGEYGQNMA